MSNSLPINSMITARMLPILRNKLPMVSVANKDFQSDISDRSRREGGLINIVKPPRYLGRSGELMQVESTVMSTVPMKLQQFGVDPSFSLTDLQLSLDDVAGGGLDYALEPAAAKIAGFIEGQGTALFRTVANSVGTPGTPPTDPSILATAGAYITSNGGSTMGDRVALLDTFANASFATGVKQFFNPGAVVDKAYANGRLGNGYSFEIYDDPAIQSFTAGVYGGTPVVNGAGQSGTSLITNGWTAGSILNAGDTFRIAGVTPTNPQTGQATSGQAFFVVAQTTTADGSGNMTIPLGVNGIVPSGQFQNVVGAPANAAALTVTSGTSGQLSRQSIAFDPAAFTFACVPLAQAPAGMGVKTSTATDKSSGLSITYSQGYDIKTNQIMTRFDVLFAWAATYPELAVRIQG